MNTFAPYHHLKLDEKRSRLQVLLSGSSIFNGSLCLPPSSLHFLFPGVIHDEARKVACFPSFFFLSEVQKSLRKERAWKDKQRMRRVSCLAEVMRSPGDSGKVDVY